MKFLYSHRTHSADGQQVHITELVDALQARGHEIVVAGPASSGRSQSFNTKRKITARSVLPAPIYEPAEYAYSLPAYLRLARLWATAKPDVLYERYNLFFHAGAWLHRKTSVPMILEVNAPLAEERARYGDLFWKGFARRSEASIWRAADKVLPVSDALAERISAAGVPDHKIAVIRNGVSNPFLAAGHSSKVRNELGLNGKVVLGFSGFVREWHGVDRAVRFIAAQGRRDLHLMIIGDGPARMMLEKLGVELGIADQMTFAGVVERDVMPDHIAAFDIALQPAVVDYASPLKLFEYMAVGKAILAPDQANIREIVTDGKDVLLFSANNSDAFDKALSALIDDAALRVRLGAAARASLVKRDLTWAGAAARVEEIAQKLSEQIK